MTHIITPGTWKLDDSHSEVGLTVRHAGISKVRAVFEKADSTLRINEDNTADIDATVDASSFNSKSPDRDGHVRSEDFLHVEEYPNLTFTAKNAVFTDGEFELTGDLTIRGVTKTVTLDAEFGGQVVDPFGITRAGFSASTVISRKDFGLTWNSALETGGFLVSDKVTIDLELSFMLEEG